MNTSSDEKPSVLRQMSRTFIAGLLAALPLALTVAVLFWLVEFIQRFLRMADIVQDAGTGFAFPSQTTYFARDTGPDAERRDKAETEVKHRRFTGKLPFPEFEEEEREQLEDILDYPPKGSPKYKPRSDKSDK